MLENNKNTTLHAHCYQLVSTNKYLAWKWLTTQRVCLRNWRNRPNCSLHGKLFYRVQEWLYYTTFYVSLWFTAVCAECRHVNLLSFNTGGTDTGMPGSRQDNKSSWIWSSTDSAVRSTQRSAHNSNQTTHSATSSYCSRWACLQGSVHR